jgi:hypothetical protein
MGNHTAHCRPEFFARDSKLQQNWENYGKHFDVKNTTCDGNKCIGFDWWWSSSGGATFLSAILPRNNV